LFHNLLNNVVGLCGAAVLGLELGKGTYLGN